MAEEIKKEELSMRINNSEIKKIKEPDFSKEVVISKIRLLPKEIYDRHVEMMRKTFKDVHALIPVPQIYQERFARIKRNIPELNDQQIDHRIYEEEINNRINNLVIRDAIFNEAMKIVVPCYEIKIDENDLKDFAKMLEESQPNMKGAPKEYFTQLATRTIEKELIFIVLAKEWNINVTDEEAKEVLMNYYKTTNNSIRDQIDKPEALNGIKSTLLENKIAARLCSSLKCKVDMEAINKNAREERAKAEELYMKHMEQQKAAEAKKEEKK